MEGITLEIPPEIAAYIKVPRKRAVKILMEELVLRLYEEGIISAGQGSLLLRMERIHFEQFLAQREISIHCSVKELYQDVSNLDHAV